MPIGYDPRLPFAQQIAFFLAKGSNLIPTARWTDVWKSQHDRAFMVAGAAKADLLKDFYGAVESAIKDGTGIGEFRKQFDQIVEKHGWAYKGEKNWRTRVIYQTNISTSYSAGRLAQLREGGFPFWLYKHSDSVVHPRPLHVSWDGLTLPADDPWWKTHYPPNGWGCKCRIVGVRNEQAAKRLGGRVGGQPPDDGTVSGTDRPKGIDKGWDYQPGASLLGETRGQLRAGLKDLPKPIAEQLAADLEAAAAPVPPPAPGGLPDFRPAKTVKAAERFAQEILDAPGGAAYQVGSDGKPLVRFRHTARRRRRTDGLGIHEVARAEVYGKAKYTGLSLDTANALNKTLIELQQECDRLGIPRLRSVKSGAGRALASMGDGVLSVSRNLGGKSLDPADALNSLLSRQVSKAIRETPLSEKPFTTEAYFSDPVDKVKSTLWHEFGHHVHQQFGVNDSAAYSAPPLERRLRDFIARRKQATGERAALQSGALVIPTRYATTNAKEFFAESYNLYKLGRSDLIDPELIPFIKSVEEGKLP